MKKLDPKSNASANFATTARSLEIAHLIGFEPIISNLEGFCIFQIMLKMSKCKYLKPIKSLRRITGVEPVLFKATIYYFTIKLYSPLGIGRFELPSLRLSGVYSYQLSYMPNSFSFIKLIIFISLIILPFTINIVKSFKYI